MSADACMTLEKSARIACTWHESAFQAQTTTTQHRMQDAVSTQYTFTDLQDQPPGGRSLKRHVFFLKRGYRFLPNRLSNSLQTLTGTRRRSSSVYPSRSGAMPSSGSREKGTPDDLCAFPEKRARFGFHWTPYQSYDFC